VKYKRPNKNFTIESFKTNITLREWWRKHGRGSDFKEFCDKNPCLTKFYATGEKNQLMNYDDVRQLAIDLGTKQGSNLTKYDQ